MFQVTRFASSVHKLFPDLGLFDLRVVDGDLGLFSDRIGDEGDCRRFASVGRVFLEGKAEDSNLLAGEIVEKAGNDPFGEASLLVLVHVDDATPVICYFVEMQRLGEVNDVEDVLLETAARRSCKP